MKWSENFVAVNPSWTLAAQFKQSNFRPLTSTRSLSLIVKVQPLHVVPFDNFSYHVCPCLILLVLGIFLYSSYYNRWGKNHQTSSLTNGRQWAKEFIRLYAPYLTSFNDRTLDSFLTLHLPTSPEVFPTIVVKIPT